jgi:hypothetical protein
MDCWIECIRHDPDGCDSLKPACTSQRSLAWPIARRADEFSTKANIEAAAKTLFAQRGYERTTIRAIASAAYIDPAMVIR